MDIKQGDPVRIEHGTVVNQRNDVAVHVTSTGITIHVPLPQLPNDIHQRISRAAYLLGDYLQLFAKKQVSYGSDNITQFGPLGILVRTSDKLARLKQLIVHNKEFEGEPVEDAWRDLLGYALIGFMDALKKW